MPLVPYEFNREQLVACSWCLEANGGDVSIAHLFDDWNPVTDAAVFQLSGKPGNYLRREPLAANSNDREWRSAGDGVVRCRGCVARGLKKEGRPFRLFSLETGEEELHP